MNVVVRPAQPLRIFASPHGSGKKLTAGSAKVLEDSTIKDIIDIKACNSRVINIDDIPAKISTTFNQDYNITYIDDIIHRKLKHEQQTAILPLMNQLKQLTERCMRPQVLIDRIITIEEINRVQKEINDINSGDKLRRYEEETSALLAEYRLLQRNTKCIVFSNTLDNGVDKFDNDIRLRISCIEKYIEIASRYHKLDIIRTCGPSKDICMCGISLSSIATSDTGTIVCPNCSIEYNTVIMSKQSKDGARISNSPCTQDESIDNFLRAFMRYQGLQHEKPEDSLYDELDEYFIKIGRPVGEEIANLPLTKRGRRGDTDHKMLWNALANIGRSDYYEDANLIGNIYWGWTLPDVMHLRENIIDKYNKTQAVFYQIPAEQRGRNSSLGTQYRLWRHLQLEGHECYIDEFKIAENPE